MGRTGYTCIRHVFCSLNVLIWLCACGMLGAGLWMRLSRIHYQSYGTFLPDVSEYVSLDVLVLSVGALTFVVAFFGCCGAWFQSRCLLVMYFGLVIILFMSEFMIGALAFIFNESITKTIRFQLGNGIVNHYNDTEAMETGTFSNMWTVIQKQYKCCGVDSPADWYHINSWRDHSWVPDSCCKQPMRYCGRQYEGDINLNKFYDNGCISAIQMELMQNLHIIGAIGLTIGFLQLFGLISSMILFCTVSHKRSTHTYKTHRQAQQAWGRQALPILDQEHCLRAYDE
ncbi:tetraspanin-9 [Phymastichus coffea]|uniref:tetraspanin-9 n=1 Tax=Phymastichus coffea TaxID=108790 RepID=UPI00273C5CDD|nr:tetraspanin-9 [Phymastichus coffea]XP_058804348.1 tetraspanin-9 [Phymastichus coffea]